MNTTESAWRKAIADQIRANCTPSSEAYDKGGDVLIAAVADWVENPPEWSAFRAPAALPERDFLTYGIFAAIVAGRTDATVEMLTVLATIDPRHAEQLQEALGRGLATGGARQ